VKILITGGTGRVGVSVVQRLAEGGHELTVIGRTAGVTVKSVRYAQCDINDFTSLLRAVNGMDAVVHLAAIPAPGGVTPEEVFRVNCSGTFNLYEAAARVGVRRVVTASSINAFGYNWGLFSFPIRSLPIDEAHPVFTTDAYSFSKQVTESIADYAWRRDGISGVCLRLPYVAPARFSSRDFVQRHAALCRASFENLMKLPDAERRDRAREWIAHREAHFQARKAEGVGPLEDYPLPDPIMAGRTDFWTRIDERDSAQAIEKSLFAEYDGCHTLFVNDSHNITGVPSLPLAELFFQEANLQKERLPGHATLVSIDAARALIGFEPEHSVGRWLE
jgi:NAD(P)-dependent dehydrogenase (short-subunit alcohol dehydrogenase family)